ncbi:MAG: tetratricopeptide repeat protein [Bryobacteraceae bacterium]
MAALGAALGSSFCLWGAVKRSAAEKALDAQDQAKLEKLAKDAAFIAEMQPNDPEAQYKSAVTNSLLAQLAIERRDKALGASAAETGIESGQRAVKLRGDNAEYHRILGTLCGQIIPANVWAGLKYGKCAMEEVGKAIELDKTSSDAWMSRGVGNYYLPPAFGGGVGLAIRDFEQAIQLNPESAEAHLWLGIAYRKAGRNADARKAMERALALNPNRKWAKEQLDKTPAQ